MKQNINENMRQAKTLQIRHEFAPSRGKSYTKIPFEVLPNTEYIVLRGCYKNQNQQEHKGTVAIGLVDAQQQIRGWSVNLNRTKQILLAEEQASYGYLAAPLQAGIWNIVLGNSRFHTSHILVELELEMLPCQARLLRGDIHGHSLYSDGVHSIETKLQMAKENNLDFLAFSDHNSICQNFCLPLNPDVLLLDSCEITTYNGHANIFGYKEKRIPNFMCSSSAEVRTMLIELKQQGSYIQCNHPIRIGDVAGCQWDWDYDMPFDWIEIWNGSWGANCRETLKIWQSLLEQGRFLPAVANSDFHNINTKQQGYPCNNVWANKKTQAEIYRAIAKGNNYLTAAPQPNKSFAAQCLCLTTEQNSTNSEFWPFGTTFGKGAAVWLELSANQAYLETYWATRIALILRVWNELGLCLEMELQAADFQKCSQTKNENDRHDRKFSLELSHLAAQETEESNAGTGNKPLQFLRFELFSLKGFDQGADSSQEKALLITNPIFWE